MTGLHIDTEASTQSARRWVEWADQINAARLQVGHEAQRLWLGTLTSWAESSMASAAAELWTVSNFLRLLVQELERLDAGPVLIQASAIDQLMWRAGGQIGPMSACPLPTYSGVDGEIGHTYSSELRSPYDIESADPSELGRRLVMRALDDTATPGQIRQDEFELVRLTDGRYLLALPGVIDLTHPGLGLDGDNRSVRDLDRSAVRSSMSTSIDGNAYARMVWEALSAAGVPNGSRIVIVGHSFGADTALDLAADPRFNGPAGYDVTHVVAAGYDSQPQLDAVPDTTKVLVLQNRSDIPVTAEAIGHAGVTGAIDDGVTAVESAAHLDGLGAIKAGAGMLWNTGKAGASAVDHAASRADDVAGDMFHLHPVDAVEDAVFPLTGSRQDGSQLVTVFDAGWTVSDGGHDQARYVDYLESTTDPFVLGFLGSLASGTAIAGTAVALDISVPDETDERAQET